jgi:hypothetical protein
MAGDHFQQLKHLQNRTFHATGNFATCTPVREMPVSLKTTYVHDHAIEMWGARAEIMQNHVNKLNVCVVLDKEKSGTGSVKGWGRTRAKSTVQQWKMPSSGMLHRVALVRTDISEGRGTSIIRATRIGKPGTTLARTGNVSTLRRNTLLVTWWRRQVPLKCRLLQALHSITFQTTAFCIVTAVKTSNLTVQQTQGPFKKLTLQSGGPIWKHVLAFLREINSTGEGHQHFNEPTLRELVSCSGEKALC